MAPPTRQFHRLSIGQDMPASRTPRAEGQPAPTQGHRDEGDDSSSAESESEEEGEESAESSDDESEAGSKVRAHSGITYDLSHLDTESEAQAMVGLMGEFDVVNCRASSEGFDFQLLDRPRVHIGPDSPTCTCSTFQDRPEGACQHIFWLLDQLHGCFLSNPPSTEVALSHNGRPVVRQRIEDLLTGKLEAVANQLNWQYLRDEGDSRTTAMTRVEKVRDVLSAFTPTILPEDFRPDLVETTTPARTAEQCVVQGDFQATIFRLAVHDDGVRSSLCKAMPAGACAAIYFDKIQDHTRRLLAGFDRYCATGEIPSNPSSPGGGPVQIDQVFEELRRSVSRIRSHIGFRAPYGFEGAAKALVFILDAISSRHKDPLDGNTWGRTSFQGEDEDQRNLYLMLIGDPDMDLEQDADLFVITALEALPPASLYQFIDELRDIRGKIEVNRAPKVFLYRLGDLIRSAELAASASGQKRPAAGNSGGHSKRTR
ncbi:hypothetical protein N7448_008106 [Penicillium atrosanguineum]|uniref:Uncharacterized protein n=1 Tax=Penicillium atrosanguineum TaxID=1132637 RepID=A0A9W9GS73_9EURO|nr:hypothetical protein N7448_008106 [Penicillium atrosanguineum]KAJ5331162.1 hypothetical protein N7476_000945 [Penicillium atrosanguineum]